MRLVGLFRSYIGNCRAASTVEFVLTFPLFFFFILVIAEIGLFFFATSVVEQGVHNYSRQLALKLKREKITTYSHGIGEEIGTYIGPRLVKSYKFEIGQATGHVDLSKPLKRSWVDRKFATDRNVPLYLRVVVSRPTVLHGLFRPIWRVIGNPKNGGLFSEIDILIVIPFTSNPQQ